MAAVPGTICYTRLALQSNYTAALMQLLFSKPLSNSLLLDVLTCIDIIKCEVISRWRAQQ